MYVVWYYPMAMYGFGFSVSLLFGYLRERREKRRAERLASLIEPAWMVISNVNNGDWNKQSLDWQVAAARWRDEYQKKYLID